MALNAKNAAPYAPTAEDRLWLLRATQAEGSPVDTIPRVLINRFMKLRAGGNKQTLTTFVRAYSQPVNPRWFPQGDLFKKNVPKPTPQQLAVATARQNILSTRQTFLDTVTKSVDAALAKSFASNATDYAAPGIGGKNMVALTPAKTGVNRLWTVDTKWAGYTVDGDAGGPNIGLLLACLAVGYAIWRST